jgi:hypothetical protein
MKPSCRVSTKPVADGIGNKQRREHDRQNRQQNDEQADEKQAILHRHPVK